MAGGMDVTAMLEKSSIKKYTTRVSGCMIERFSGIYRTLY